MSPLRYSIAVGMVAMVLPLAHAQNYAAKPAAAQGATLDGAAQKKMAAKAVYAGAAAKAASAQPQPAQQPNPPESYNNAAVPARKPIPPSALAQVPAAWAAKVLQVPVPDFSGMTLLQVQKEAIAPGGRPLFLAIYPQSPLTGVVVKDSQYPKAGTMVVPGRQRLSLRLTVPPPLDGSKRTLVPPVKGLGFQQVAVLVRQAHLRPVFSGATSNGVAGDPSPPAGTPVDPGTAVTVVFALPPVLVPPLKGLTLDAARQQLAASFLQLGTVADATDTGATVASQSPQPLTLVERGTPVNVTLQAVPPLQVPVPDVTSRSCAQARALILAARLQPAWNGCPQGSLLVNSQIPVSGTMVDPQSLVSAFYAPVAVPPLLGLSSQAAADRLSVAGLKAVVSAPPGWDPAKSIVASQFPQPGVLLDVGADVNVEMRVIAWWERVPGWGWVAIGLAGLTGLALLVYLLYPPSPPPPSPPVPPPPVVVTLQPHSVAGKVRLGKEGGPKVRLTVALRDRASKSKITSADQPAVREMEVS